MSKDDKKWGAYINTGQTKSERTVNKALHDKPLTYKDANALAKKHNDETRGRAGRPIAWVALVKDYD